MCYTNKFARQNLDDVATVEPAVNILALETRENL